MSMFNDIDWTRTGNSEQCFSNSEHVKNYAKKFTQGDWTFLWPGSEKKWYGKPNYLPEGKCQDTANMMVKQFEESRHPVFKGVFPLTRGILRKKYNKESIHLNADASTAELLYRIIHCYWSSTELRNTKKRSQLTRICKEAAFIHEIAVGRFYRTVLEVDDGFGDRTPVCRQCTSPRADSIEIQIASTISSERTSWAVIYRGQPRRGRVTSSRARTQSHRLQKEPNLVLQRWTNLASRKLVRSRCLFLGKPQDQVPMLHEFPR